jgi:hypothetical protein
MALTVSVLDPPVFSEFTGQKGYKRARVLFDASYPTGGLAITAANLGLTSLDTMQITGSAPSAATTSDYVTWNASTGKLMAFASNGAAPAQLVEMANATSLAALQVDVLAYGKL